MIAVRFPHNIFCLLARGLRSFNVRPAVWTPLGQMSGRKCGSPAQVSLEEMFWGFDQTVAEMDFCQRRMARNTQNGVIALFFFSFLL